VSAGERQADAPSGASALPVAAPVDAAGPGGAPSAGRAPAVTIPVSETFLSLQGEGGRAGVVSYFIRVSGCNLRCGWCDTPYASWAPEGAAASVEELVRAARASGAPDAVITGGEPMLFDAVEPLSRALEDAGLHVTIETAGTIARAPRAPGRDAGLACGLMSISPKLSNSTPAPGDGRDPGGVWRARHEQRRINLDALRDLIAWYPRRQLKFVVTGPEDLDEIEALLRRLPPLPPDEVLLMPEGVAPPAPGSTAWIVEACLRRGWRYGHRLHIELFGHRRGT
jgi:7-carboxy-7-deazaguanine synthase